MIERIENEVVENNQTEGMKLPNERLSRWRPIVETGLLLLAGCLMFYTAVFNGQTYDELAHINTGLAFWTQGKPDLDPLHPPLRVILGLPAYWLLAPAPQDFLTPLPPAHASAILLGARLIIVALFLSWSWFFGRMVARWLGLPVGLAALALILFEPTMVAHACLATTDILLMMASFLAVAAAFEWLRRPGWARAFLLGVALGLTMLAKFNSVLLIIGLGMGAVVWWLLKGRSLLKGRPLVRVVGQLGFALIVAWVIFCTPYRFVGVGTQMRNLPVGRSDFGRTVKSLGVIPCPVPDPVMQGIDELLALQLGRVSYFHGQMRPAGAFFLVFPGATAV